MSAEELRLYLYHKIPHTVLEDYLQHQSRNFVPFLKERDYMGRLFETETIQQKEIGKIISSIKKKRIHLNGKYLRTITYLKSEYKKKKLPIKMNY